jgi:outer membrane scaffolding protein for murein synthesis (MipA/OmpV family)
MLRAGHSSRLVSLGIVRARASNDRPGIAAPIRTAGNPPAEARMAVACAAGLAALASTAIGAQAADLALAPAAVPAVTPSWIVTLTANGQVGPRYPGSDEYTVFGYPSLSFRRAGEPRRFSTPDDGISLALYDTPQFRAGLAGRYRGGRYDGSDRRLTGLEDVQWAVEPGVFVEYWPFEFLRARAELRHGFGGHHGFVADLGLDFVQRFGAFTVAAGPRLALGDGDFTRAYFGVRPFEAALNGVVTPYRPSGGVTTVGAATSVSYDLSPQCSSTVSASYGRLVSDAADSPIVKSFGSENQLTVGLSLSYSFATTGW